MYVYFNVQARQAHVNKFFRNINIQEKVLTLRNDWEWPYLLLASLDANKPSC